MILIICLVVSLLLNGVLATLLFVGIKKLLRLDELFTLLQDDIQVNLRYLKKVLDTPLFFDNAEVRGVQKNLRVIWDRLVEFSRQINERSGKAIEIIRDEDESPEGNE